MKNLLLTTLLFANWAYAEKYPTVCDIQLHETAWDGLERHVEVSYLDDNGKRIFFNPYHNITHRPPNNLVGGSDLIFTIRLSEDEFVKFKESIKNRGGYSKAGWCSSGSCKIISEATGMFLPTPIVFFPRTMSLYFLFLRALNAKRVISAKIVGSAPTYTLGRQLMPAGLLETGAVIFLVHKGIKKLINDDEEEHRDSKYKKYEVEVELNDSSVVKKIIYVESEE